jgi:uncharacterized RmlC-like cupin family protein
MQIVTIPPGARAKAHKHENHETAIYALRGESHVWHGEKLEHHSIVKPGDFFYIPANVPHLPYNPSDTEEVVALISRTDANEQESVFLLPELDGLHSWPRSKRRSVRATHDITRLRSRSSGAHRGTLPRH